MQQRTKQELARAPQQTKQNIIGLTGTPATGKKTVGKIVAKRLGYEFLEINKLAKGLGAEVSKDEEGIDVDALILYKKLPNLLKGKKAVVAGHLLPHCLPDKSVNFVAVLRCSPRGLVQRYKKRGYSSEKIKSNIVAEAIDVCLSDALDSYKKSKISEIDTSNKKPEQVAGELVSKFLNPKKREIGIVNWLQMMIEDDTLREFLR